MRKKKEKNEKERRKKELRPAIKYVVAAAVFVLVLLVLIVFHNLFRSGRLSLKETYNETLLRLKSAYRESDAVVEAFCLYSYKEDSGEGFSCYEINSVLSGENESIREDSRITVKTFDNAGERHLLYISKDTEEGEKGFVYSVVKENNFLIKNGSIVVDGRSSVPIETLAEEIGKIRSELMIPFQYNYYRSLKNLIKNCDLIFLGKVTSVREEGKCKCMIAANGEKQERTLEITKVRITVLNDLDTELNYGETIEIAVPEEGALRTVDFITGKSFSGEEKNESLKEGDICIFFLTACEDSKENVCFLVNEYQGFIMTNGDYVLPCRSNAPFSSITSLYGAVETILNEIRSG